MKIGILGGTFDPIHNAHLTIAEEVRHILNLGRVIFVPAGKPWLKTDRVITAAEHRVNMVRLAIEGKPYFGLSLLEVERSGPTYTIQTLEELRRDIEPDDELYLILGYDSLAQLPRWRDPEGIAMLCKIAAIPRPDYHLPDLTAVSAAVPGLARSLILLDRPLIDISSTDIRERVASGQDIANLVPAAVADYIHRHGLYKSNSQPDLNIKGIPIN